MFDGRQFLSEVGGVFLGTAILCYPFMGWVAIVPGILAMLVLAPMIDNLDKQGRRRYRPRHHRGGRRRF